MLAKRPRNEYEYEDHALTRRYGHHDHALSSTSGYVNRSWEDVRLGERGRDGVGVRSLRESREQYVSLAPYNYDNHRVGLANPPSDHVLPPDASSTLFVEGLPSNCSVREAAHIFRHFLGFKEVRIVNKSKESRNKLEVEPSVNVVVLCFVDFDNPKFAATAMEALQGYRMDKDDRDSPSLKLQFAHPPRNRNGLPFARSNDRGRAQQDEYRRR